jgi:hypothetical protein
MKSLVIRGVVLWVVVLAFAVAVFADQSVSPRETFVGPLDFFATGGPLASDTDADGSVDTDIQPASVSVSASDIASGATLVKAFLYWGGSVPQPPAGDCMAGASDDQVVFAAPGGTPTTVTADTFFCSAASATLDMQVYRADVSGYIGALAGTYTVDGFSALIGDEGLHNASFSVVLVYTAPNLPRQRISLYDGLQTFASSSQTFSLTGLDLLGPPNGKLTWYVLDGDVGGSGVESVTADGVPGVAGPVTLQDAINPATDPMNHTINTGNPVQTNSIGVDIDQWDISGALSPGDTSVDITYSAGIDQWWFVYQLIATTIATNAEIDVSPASVGFGDVSVGSTSSQIVTVSNIGGGNDLGVGAIYLSSAGGEYSILSSSATPVQVAQGATLDIEVGFSPTATGLSSNSLHIISDDPDLGEVIVPLTGNGVASEPPPEEQVEAILQIYDAAVVDGNLSGSGPGNSGQGRLGALRNMIEAAGDYITGGQFEEACGQLGAALDRMDGSSKPPDFVTGSAVTDLITQIQALRVSLECP